MRKIIISLLFALVLPCTRAVAEDIVQVRPFVTTPGITEDDGYYMELELVNESYDKVGIFSFDLQLPAGMHYSGYEFPEERIPYYEKQERKRGKVVTTKEPAFSVSHGTFKAGFERFIVMPEIIETTDETTGKTKRSIFPITGQRGVVLYLYFTTDADMKPGVYPIKVLASKEGTVIARTSTEGIYPVTSSSYVVVKENDDDPNPLTSSSDLDLSMLTNYMPSFIVDSLNKELSQNVSLRTLNLSGIDSLGATLSVPQNVVWCTAKEGGLLRPFTAGKKSTICLPFALPADKAAEIGRFWQFGGLKNGTTDVVTMRKVEDDLVANTPYIVEPIADLDDIEFASDRTCTVTTAESVGEGFVFHGIYNHKLWETGDADLGTVYGFAAEDMTLADGRTFHQGQFVKAAAGASIAPFRAYLQYEGSLSDTESAFAKSSSTEALPDTIKIEWTDDTTTGITSVGNRPTKVTDERWYTLDGRRLTGRPTCRGLYLHGGKKTVIDQ